MYYASPAMKKKVLIMCENSSPEPSKGLQFFFLIHLALECTNNHIRDTFVNNIYSSYMPDNLLGTTPYCQ